MSLNATLLRGSSGAFVVTVADAARSRLGLGLGVGAHAGKTSFAVSSTSLSASVTRVGDALSVWVTDTEKGGSVEGAAVQLFHVCDDDEAGALHDVAPR